VNGPRAGDELGSFGSSSKGRKSSSSRAPSAGGVTSLLDRYRPRPEWFAHDPAGIHDIAHVTRVLVWAEQLAAWMNDHGRPVDAEVVRCAAVTHDVGRHDDGRDPEHGLRSARWVREHRAALPVALDDRQLDALAFCCEWHVPPDERAPYWTNELVCLKDADGLDRVRIFDLDPRRLRTERARELTRAAQRLYDASRRAGGGDPWQGVRDASLAQGQWR
jgi:hypothetical protein